MPITRQKKLFFIICIIIALGIIGSLITYFFLFQKNKREITYIGLTVTEDRSIEKPTLSMQNGAQLFLDEFNSSKRLKSHKINLKNISLSTSGNNAFNNAKTLESVVAIIGNISANNISYIDTLYNNKNISLLNNQSIKKVITTRNNWLYSLSFEEDHQAKFIANYTHNVLDEDIITIVHANTNQALNITNQFAAVYERFGTLINYTYPFDINNTQQSIADIIYEIKDKQDLGMIFIVGNAVESARFIVQARQAGIENKIVGTDVVGHNEFINAINQLKKDNTPTADYTHQLLFTSPLLFDTANAKAQQFKNLYLNKYGIEPDWVAAYAYHAAKIITAGMLENSTKKLAPTPSYRQKIKAYLATLSDKGKQKIDIGEAVFLTKNGERKIPVQMGIYEGRDIIAATTQLQPIKKNITIDYLQELKKGKILYVNNTFMYKTDVIYTGIELKRINSIDFDKEIAELDFNIWFRYKGNFNPADIVFSNLVADQKISLKKPLLSDEKKGYFFRLYHIKAKFKLNFQSFKRVYGSHLIGLDFKHRVLNKNNIIYVADVLGMNFSKKLRLKEKLEKNTLLLPSLGWGIQDAWLSQGIKRESSLGDPSYVGYNVMPALFSNINYSILLKETKVNIHNLIPTGYYIYISIFGFVAAAAARIIDQKLTGHFWLMSSWIIRVISWPLLLISISNLGIEEALKKELTPEYIEQLIRASDAGLCLLISVLVNLAINRFYFKSIEQKTGHKVPGLIRYCITIIVYIISIFYIIAVIYNKPLGHLLAGSGVLAMIIGIAIQGNVANIFSGILLNIEKPFSIGHWLKIGAFDKIKVIDITWRSVRVIDRQNNIISIPNGTVASSQIINYSSTYSRIDQEFSFSEEYKPSLVISLLKRSLENMPEINIIKATQQSLISLEVNGTNTYLVSFFIKDIGEEIPLKVKVLEAIHASFLQAGYITIAPDENTSTEDTPLVHPSTPKSSLEPLNNDADNQDNN